MPGRTYNGTAFRFGFNNQEKLDDIEGVGNALSFKHRIYSSRLGKFLSVDPIGMKYPWNSSYAFAENRVIEGLDLEGLEFAKPQNPEAHTLLVVPTTAGTKDYEFNQIFHRAMADPKVDVLKVNSLADLVIRMRNEGHYKLYDNLIISDHGVTGSHKTQIIGQFGYYKEDIQKGGRWADNMRALGGFVRTNGKIVLLGCFTSTSTYNADGQQFLKAFSQSTNRAVYGSQGESYPDNAFKNVPIGGIPPMPNKMLSPDDFKRALDGAGKWSVAKPDGSITSNIGNIKIDANGTLSTTKDVYKPPVQVK